MAAEREYIVLAFIPDEGRGGRVVNQFGPVGSYRQIGKERAGSPEQAITAAVAGYGLPSEQGGPVVAIPARNWNERVVGYERRPVIDTPVDAEVAD